MIIVIQNLYPSSTLPQLEPGEEGQLANENFTTKGHQHPYGIVGGSNNLPDNVLQNRSWTESWGKSIANATA